MLLLKRLVISAIIAALLLIAIAVLLPRSVHIERSIVVSRPAATLFTVLNRSKSFNLWSPWHRLDTATRYQYGGPDRGVGAQMRWSSDNPNVGIGSRTIIQSIPWRLIQTELDFGNSNATTGSLEISEGEDGITVTWALDSEFGNNIVARYVGLLYDSLAGPDLEKGLAALKQLVEQLPEGDFSTLNISISSVDAQPILYASGSSSDTPEAISQALAAAFESVLKAINENDSPVTGMPLAIIREWRPGEIYLFDAAIPVDLSDLHAVETVKPGETYAGRVIKVVQVGPYHVAHQTLAGIEAYVATHSLQKNGPPWAQFVTDPNEAGTKVVTHIYFPIKGSSR